MPHVSDIYQAAEKAMEIPPASRRGYTNENPKDIDFWALVREDFNTHERKVFEQGFWALFVHRFGNWRMGQPKLIRAPSTVIYAVMFKLIEWFCGISLWYTTKVGRRVRIWHHSGMMIGARAIGDDVHIRQNTTFGVAQTGKDDDLPIIAPGADIGAGACIAGAVYVGREAKVGANALVITDVPDGATVMGNPAQVYAMAPVDSPEKPKTEAQSEPAANSVAAPIAKPAEPVMHDVRQMGSIALLGSANLDYLAMSFAEMAQENSLEIETYVPPFGQAYMQLLQVEAGSDLASVGASLIVERAEDLLGDVYADPLSLAEADMDGYLEDALEPLFLLITAARDKLQGPVFVMSLAVMTRSSLAMADVGQTRGLNALITKANAMLAAHVAELPDVIILQSDEMIAEVGRAAAQPGQFWHMGRVPFSQTFGNHLARRVLGSLLALRGQTARLLVLDLDNTLWGGVLGEDGMEGLDIGGTYPGEAYHRFQAAIKALSLRGIALAVASKNDEDLALKMISEHPEMVLRPDDIITHRIGWTEKAIGIQDMLEEMSLGAQNCMFIDDNPVEREKVRKNIPGCIVPEFPDAPEKLADWLLNSPFVECLELTTSDTKRTQQYKARAKTNASKRAFENIEDFYRDLGMQLTFESYGPTNQKRVLQLFVKTNQFNATLRRHDAAAVDQILAEGGEIYAIGVADKHSAYELMGVIVLRPDAAMKAAYPEDATIQGVEAPEAFWVDNLLLSCRILGRTVENAIVAWATGKAKKLGASSLYGYVIEAPRNTPVRDVYSQSGFATVEVAQELGAGGLYLADTPIDVPDYFEVSYTPPEPKDETTAAHSRPKPPSAPKVMPKQSAAPVAAVILAADTEARLAATFRQTFGLTSDIDLETATMDTVSRWDSLGHLKLAMEIDKSMGIHLPGDRLGQINSYAALKAAIGAQSV